MHYPWIRNTLVFIFLAVAFACSNKETGANIQSLNVHRPNLLTQAKLESYQSCEALLKDFRQRFLDQADTSLYQNSYWATGTGDSAGGNTASSPTSSGVNTGAEGGSKFSGTNNQEPGIDEADISKLDGNYIYTINGNLLEILSASESGDLAYKGKIELDNQPSSLLLVGKRAVVFSSSWQQKSQTRIDVVDVSNPSQPQLEKSVVLDGTYVTARLTPDNRVLLVASYSPNNPLQTYATKENVAAVQKQNEAAAQTIALSDFLPALVVDGSTQSIEKTNCSNVSTAMDSNAVQLAVLLSLSFDESDQFQISNQLVMSNYPVVYANATTLLLAESQLPYFWYQYDSSLTNGSNIHRFDISGPEVQYTGSGRVQGTVRDQFSLSEYNGYVRVATTDSPAQPIGVVAPLGSPETISSTFIPSATPESQSIITVLQGESELEIVGKLEGIAKGESIWATRFYPDHAYLVTYKQVDPLFTVDLSHPEAPSLKGQLKVNGVGTYLQEINNGNYLLSVGYGGNSNGLDWTVQVSLFDITDFSNPKQASALTLGRSNQSCSASSEATSEHKAVMYFAPKNVLAIPVNINCFFASGASYFNTRLDLIDVIPGSPLKYKGSVDQTAYFNVNGIQYATTGIRRAFFYGDYLYAISQMVVTVSAEAAPGSILKDVLLQGSTYMPPIWK